jgi:hypothetical protein
LGVAGIVLGTTLDATDVLRADTGRSRTDQSAV